MDYKTVKSLLNKYYSGMSSLQEEEELRRQLIHGDDLPDELLNDKAIFAQFKLFREIRYPVPELKKSSLTLSRFPLIAASIIVLLGIGLLTHKLVSGTFIPSPFNKTIAIVNENNPAKRIILPGNNIVWLNRNSRVSYPKRFTKKEDVVRVIGEAFFEFHQDTDPAFRIVAGKAFIKPESGSSFNIQAYPNKESAEICVETGAVAVSDNNDWKGLTLLVVEGNYCSVHNHQKLVFAASITDSNYLSWKTGKLKFEDTYLATVRDALSEYYKVQIEFEDNSLAYCKFTGEFMHEPIMKILNRIRSEFEFDIHIREDIITLSGEGCFQQ